MVMQLCWRRSLLLRDSVGGEEIWRLHFQKYIQTLTEMALNPAEQHLRHVEKDVLIPTIMREKAKERCSEQVQDFTKCCKEPEILVVVKCQRENPALKECLTAFYNNPAFYSERNVDTEEREEFGETGIPTKERPQERPTSMQTNMQVILSNSIPVITVPTRTDSRSPTLRKRSFYLK